MSILNFQFSILNSITDAPALRAARRGRRAQFRPPLPSSPIVGEGDLGEQWLDGIGWLWSVPTLPLHKTGCACVLPRLPQGRRLASTALFFLRQRRCLPSALRNLNALKGIKDLRGLRGPSWPSRQHTPPPLRGTPSNLEGDLLILGYLF